MAACPSSTGFRRSSGWPSSLTLSSDVGSAGTPSTGSWPSCVSSLMGDADPDRSHARARAQGRPSHRIRGARLTLVSRLRAGPTAPRAAAAIAFAISLVSAIVDETRQSWSPLDPPAPTTSRSTASAHRWPCSSVDPPPLDRRGLALVLDHRTPAACLADPRPPPPPARTPLAPAPALRRRARCRGSTPGAGSRAARAQPQRQGAERRSRWPGMSPSPVWPLGANRARGSPDSRLEAASRDGPTSGLSAPSRPGAADLRA